MGNINKFVEDNMPAAIAAGDKLGVSPDVLLGQWGLETGWGKSVIPGTNNLGNIKDLSGSGVTAKDNMNGSVDKYRAYESPDAFGADYANLLGNNQRYKGALNAGTDAHAFASGLKAGGYAEDPNYVGGVVKASNMAKTAILGKISQNIVADLRAGHSPADVVAGLIQSPTIGADVKDAISQGKSVDRILEVAGGDHYQDYVKTNPTYGMSTAEKALSGAGKKFTEFGRGAMEAVHAAAGDTDALAQDRADTAERNRLDAPLMDTTAGSVGHGVAGAAPYAVAGALTGGAGLTGLGAQVLSQGAAGAIDGAITPTTADGQRFDNAVHGAESGAIGAGVGYGIGKGLGWVGGKLGASPAEAAAIESKIAQAKAQGLPVSASNLTNTGKNLAEGLNGNSTVQAFRDKVDKALAGKVGEGVGIQGADAVDHSLIQSAKPSVWNRSNAVLDSTDVNLSPTLVQDVQAIVQGTQNPLTAGITTNSTIRQAAANLLQAQQAGQAVPARALQELNSELKALATIQSASSGERVAAGKMVGEITGAINGAMSPADAAAYQLANKQHVNLKAIENMVKASNDSGVVTPRQMLNAVKTGRFKDYFMAGDAPYQDLATTASDLYGPAAGRGLGAEFAKSVNRGLDGAITYGTFAEPTVGIPALMGKKVISELLAKAITSENPTVIKLLTGTTNIQKKLADPAFKQSLVDALSETGAATSAAINKKNK